MTTKLENTSVSRWLAELRMECYKKNLETYDTVKPLLELKDLELKKLGVTNSKDRSTMLVSLAGLKSTVAREESSPVLVRTSSASDSKSVSRRSSIRNFNLKGLLGNSGSRKSKKTREGMSVATPPPLSSALDLHMVESPDTIITTTCMSPGSPPPTKSYPIPDYEELGDYKPSPGGGGRDTPSSSSSSGYKAIPNEYVPSPPEMEQFRGRAYTVGVCQPIPPNPSDVPLRRLPEGLARARRDSANTATTASDDDARSTRSNTSSLHKSHHLSVVSMESGLSFGYDVEINPNLPLEVQPWFHGKLSREDSASLLHDEGDFLVRENTALANTYTLSMLWRGQFDHTLIQCDEVVNSRNGTTVKFSFDGGAFDSIPELIYHHLKYQIPIDRDTQNMLMTPINRAGTRIPFTPAGYYPPPSSDRGEKGHSLTSTERSSPSSVRNEDHTHHHAHRLHLKRTSSPDTVRTYLRPLRSSSMSPGAGPSPRHSPGRELARRHRTSSSGDLIEEDVDRPAVMPRNAMSPPPTVGCPAMRPRAMTDSMSSSSSSSRGVRVKSSKRDSFGDYEVMESVSLLESPPSQRKVFPHSASPSPAQSLGDVVKYAEIQHVRKPQEQLTRRSTYSGQHPNTPSSSSSSSGVKYAEVRFQRKQHSQPNFPPHPFSVQTSPVRVNPYQSRAEVLAQKLQLDSQSRTPTTSSPSASPSHQRVNRADSSPHPFSGRYSTHTHSLPRQASSPISVMDGITEETTTTAQPATTATADTRMHSLPRRRSNTPHRETSRSSLATDTLSAAKTGSGGGGGGEGERERSLAERVPKNLPGYDLLVTLHGTLSRSSETELAYHLTRADAVAFLLTPRPGEDKDVWKERVQKTTSSSGLYVGLQTLADSDGDKLWKKLYFRHQSLSQTVALSIVSAGDAIERARTLQRFVELAFVLQSGAYGNLFSFISIMQGLTFPQITNMSQTWQLFRSVFPEASHTHKQLQDILSSLGQGVSVYSTDDVAIPAIQHLRTAFHFEEPALPGHASSAEDHTLLGQHANLLVGLDGIHSIIKHASRFSYNARKRLESLQYNVKLMDFFGQDFTRSYMHSIGVTQDDHSERRRRFDVLLSALADRVEPVSS